MLDQKPDSDADASPDSADTGSADDFLFDKPAAGDNAASAGEAGGSGGGMLGRFRAGVTAKGEGPRLPPLWRRILVFVVKWLAILGLAFVLLSLLAVWIIGWTGPPSTLNMAARAMAGVEVKRDWVKLSDVSPNIVRAVIAAEDQDFCAHDGFDFQEIQKAIDDAERGRRVRGASTISQQTAKNVFLWNGGGFVRKGFEAWFTVLIEAMWSKPRIMEVYLNVAEWGDGHFGVDAAAQARFGVSADKLTQRQAALLASVLPSPNRWKVDGNYAGRRAGQVQSLMRMVRRDDLDACVIR